MSASGTARKTFVSALSGMIISLNSSLNRSAKFWSIPPNFPAYCGPTLSCIFATNFRSTHIMKMLEKSAAKVNPGNVGEEEEALGGLGLA